jgi:glycosyltransferase involved in cell wall biosynthesis
VNILIVHNFYQQAGGEDEVFRAECELLRSRGHCVAEYVKNNNEIRTNGANAPSSIALAMRAVWSSPAYHELRALLERVKADVVHFHNTFPLMSSAVYSACREVGVPVVQTLHNFRLLCPNALLLRDGRICEDCVGKGIPWPAVLHRCYRDSRPASAAIAAMLTTHRVLGTWQGKVDLYIALSEFSRAKFVNAGLLGTKIVVKPNFVFPDPRAGSRSREDAVFLGRLSEEKGLRTLLHAWTRIGANQTLRVVGNGPLLDTLRMETRRLGLSNVRVEGRLSHEESLAILRGARVLIVPSDCYENFPMAIAEAYACGTPVIASRLGSIQELVHDGLTGLHVNPGDPEDLAKKIEWAWAHPEEMRRMGENARAEYEAKYTSERNYALLMRIYERVLNGTTSACPEGNA